VSVSIAKAGDQTVWA